MYLETIPGDPSPFVQKYILQLPRVGFELCFQGQPTMSALLTFFLFTLYVLNLLMCENSKYLLEPTLFRNS